MCHWNGIPQRGDRDWNRNVHGEIAAENFCEKYKVYRFKISRTKQNKPREKNDQTYKKQNSEN